MPAHAFRRSQLQRQIHSQCGNPRFSNARKVIVRLGVWSVGKKRFIELSLESRNRRFEDRCQEVSHTFKLIAPTRIAVTGNIIGVERLLGKG
jgi:hypothetical protein